MSINLKATTGINKKIKHSSAELIFFFFFFFLPRNGTGHNSANSVRGLPIWKLNVIDGCVIQHIYFLMSNLYIFEIISLYLYTC